jgi:YVTN family beta-propeller protein
VIAWGKKMLLRVAIPILFCLMGVVLASAPGRGLLLVCNKGDMSLGIVDVDAGKQLATVAEGGKTGHEVAASPDGKTAYVPIYGDSGVGKPGTDGDHMVVIDIASRKVTAKVDFGHGVRPHLPVFGPKNGMLYVTTELDQAITVIDPKTLKITGKIPTGQRESHMLAISHDGRRGYTANVGPGTVSVLDLDARKTVTVIEISGMTQRISISPDDKWVFTSDQEEPRLAVIETATNKVKTWVPLPAAGYGTAPTPDGKFLLVDVQSKNLVAIVDLTKMKVVKSLDVPKAPQAVVVRPDGKEAYVSCDASHKIAVIDTASWSVKGTIDAGVGADGLAWLQ